MSILFEKYQHGDRFVNVLLDIASSGSIAAWAVWKSAPMVWGGIIAGSQLVTAIKPYFPYFKYVKEFI